MRTLAAILLGLVCVAAAAQAPPPERILPKDAILVLAVPDFPKARASFAASAYGRFWDDPAMRPFRQDFQAKLKAGLVGLLEKEAGINPAECLETVRGQLTLALIRDDATGEIAPVLIADAREEAPKLKRLLAGARDKWIAAGRQFKSLNIHGVEFDDYIIARSEFNRGLPGALLAGREAPSLLAQSEDAVELFASQVDSVLVLSASRSAAEKIAVRLTGGLFAALDDEPLFAADYRARLRGAQAYLWIDAQAILNTLGHASADPDDPEAPASAGLDFRTLLSASGFSDLKTAACVWRADGDGFLSQFFLGIPEDSRNGLFSILPAGEKDTSPPPFVPSDAIEYFRWRLDMSKAWVAFEQLLREVNPNGVESLDYLLQNAGKARDETYNLRAELVESLGSDLIVYEKKTSSGAQPNLVLLAGSTNPERLAAALQVAFELLGQGAAVRQTDFLGRKLRTFSNDTGDILSFAAGASYVAFSRDPSLIQEYLRGPTQNARTLADTPGWAAAAQRAGGMNSAFFGYENQRETLRQWFDSLRAGASAKPAVPSRNPQPVAWADFSLLPPFDAVKSRFGYSVYSGRSSLDGFTVTFFAPAPVSAP